MASVKYYSANNGSSAENNSPPQRALFLVQRSASMGGRSHTAQLTIERAAWN